MTEPRTHRLSKERPFPGLRPFGFDDHEYFFGREDQTYALYRLIARSRFVAVVGSSGSGKSSLVRAGLQPLIQQESAEDLGRVWLQAEMRPGDAPLNRLVDAIASLAQDDDPVVAAARRERIAINLRDSHGLEDALGEIKAVANASVLLIVDQFEELFRYMAFPRRNRREEAQSRDEAVRFVQILLQTSRSRTSNVHVLLTMRSDFIGDCARFQGLPEAVSAAQFLVPSLTRDQLEDVIRGPAEHAGAAVDPVLVNILINDSTDEPDQLPVLQHCLLRIWECAGSDASANPTEPAAPARTLTVDHYDKIGRIAEALSRHADKVLGDLEGRQMAVEQTFRALAEVDKEGRATRRALKFSQLLDESGVSEGDLRCVLDRYREDDCSFLVPSPSAVPQLEPDTRIDVGHEALLRRWRRVSGDPDALPDDNSSEAIGWLDAEQHDGKQYRELLGRLEDGVLPFKGFDRRLKWWRSRPRTPAWGQRYGGRFADVRALFDTTIVRRKSKFRYAVGASAAAIMMISTIGWFTKRYIDERNVLVTTNTHATKVAEHNFKVVAHSTDWLLSTILSSLRNERIPKDTAKALLETAEKTISESAEMNHDPALRTMGIELALTASDIESVLGNKEAALRKARAAKATAAGLSVVSEPNPKLHADIQMLLYRASFRIGDVVVESDKAEGLKEYQYAQSIIIKLSNDFTGEHRYRQELVFITNKIGETLQQTGNIPLALEQFQGALKIAEKLVADGAAIRHEKISEWWRLLAATRQKIGYALMAAKPLEPERILKELDAAIAIQQRLAGEAPKDTAPRSNLAITQRVRADFLAQSGKFDAALQEYRAALKIREELVSADPSDMRWRGYLATVYANYGAALSKSGDAAGAREQFQKEVETRRVIAQQAPADEALQRAFSASHTRLSELEARLQASPETTGSVPR